MIPSQRRARLITTVEGKFLNLDDIKTALNDDAFVEECAMMLVVGRQQGASHVEMIRRTIACAILILSGEEQSAKRKLNQSSPQS